MRKFKVIFILAAAAPLALLTWSCESLLEGYEESPNAATEVSIDQLYTAAQVEAFYVHEGYIARSAAIWMEQMMGTDRQYASLALYAITEGDHDTEWNMMFTGGGLVDLRNVQEKADELGRPHYKGMAQVLEAFKMSYITAFWGDAPYSEALNPDVTEPKLDKQADIYSALYTLLDNAIANLSKSDGGVLPENDMIFDGDVSKWIEFAYSLKARLHMHWVETGTGHVATALAAAEKGISSLSGTASTLHTSTSTEANSWFQFYVSRDSYMTAGNTLVELLKARNDPRLTIYFSPASDTTAVIGAKRGDTYSGQSYLNFDYFGDKNGVDILSYEENLLIMAECYYRQSDEANALAKLNEARAAIEEKWGLDAGSLPALDVSGTALMDAISEEKYCALFLNPEVWNDFKRNCYPALSTSADVPGRFIYSDDERNANTNIPTPEDQPARNDNDPDGCS